MEGFLERGWSPILIGCVRKPPSHYLAYILPGWLWLCELRSQSTINQCVNTWFSHHARLCRPGLSGYAKRAWDSILPWWRCPYARARSISGKGIQSAFHFVRGGVDTASHCYIVPAFLWHKIFGGFMNRGPYLPRVRRKCPPLMGLYKSRTGLWSSNQSTISQRDWDFLIVRGGVNPRRLGFLPRLVETLNIWNDLLTGDGTQSSQGGAGSTYEPQPIRTRPVGLGFPHRAGSHQPG